jgi:hypothetical protein
MDGSLWVASWSYDSLLTKISIPGDSILGSLVVGFQPNSMIADRNGMIWILCDGGYTGIPGGKKPARLVKVHPNHFSIEKIFLFEEPDATPTKLCTNASRDSLFFLNQGVFAFHIEDTILPSAPIISGENRNFYGLTADPVNGDIYVSDAGNYYSEGTIYRYRANGTLISFYKSGVNPCFMVFRD